MIELRSKYLNMMPTMQAWIITPTTDWSTKWSWKTIPKNKMLIWVEKLQEIHLKAHNKDCLRAFLRCHSSSITNCMLSLNTARGRECHWVSVWQWLQEEPPEEEDRGKVVDVDNAGRPVGFLLFVRKVVRFQVSVVEDDHPPIMDSISGKDINWVWALIF